MSRVRVATIEIFANENNKETQERLEELINEIRYNKLIIGSDLSETSKIEPIPLSNTCNHRDVNGKLTIDYWDTYEMRSSSMVCKQCDKLASRYEFENNEV